MNATEMFEQLGYLKEEWSSVIIYINEELREFVFLLESKQLLCRQVTKEGLTYGQVSITQDEYIAIHEQLKELGWLLEENKEPVLTEEGKAYLSNLLKPYGLGSCAFQFNLSEVVKNDTYKLSIADEYGIIINLAIRQDTTMQELFRKMQFNKVYTTKELGL